MLENFEDEKDAILPKKSKKKRQNSPQRMTTIIKVILVHLYFETIDKTGDCFVDGNFHEGMI